MTPKHTVLEVAMEIAYSSEVLEKVAARHGAAAARACAMSNSVGGIGPLLKERIPAQAELGIEVVAVGLLYDNVWIQGFYQWGQIFIEKKPVGRFLREVLEDTGLLLDLEMRDGSRKRVKVWRAALGKAGVYLLDDPTIANVVYPGPEDAPHGHPDPGGWSENQRLDQSWLVGRGALALLKLLDKKPGFIIQSETLACFANPAIALDEFQKDPFFADARVIFNDHTPLEYAHPIWNEAQVQKARLDPAYCKSKRFWDANRRTVNVSRFLIGMSHGTFGVAKKHREVMAAMPSLKDFKDKIRSITNGVSVDFWQDPEYRGCESLSDEALLALKDKKRAQLVEWTWKRYGLWVGWKAAVKGKCLINWTRRVTTYKRFDVLHQVLTDAALRRRFLATDVALLVGGRIHQNDNLSHNVMFQLLDIVTRDPELSDRVVVLDNYNIWDAPRIFRGVDATIMLSDDGREASATGFMKAQVNGAMVIATLDGAVPESVHFLGRAPDPSAANGFLVPYLDGQIRPASLVEAFESLSRVYRDPAARARMVRASFRARDQVDIDRTAREMLKLYDIFMTMEPR